jgi:hypothetical protein
MEDKLSILTDEYVGELNWVMLNEIVDLTLNSARDRILLFCGELVRNNHILENEIEVKRRIRSFICQEFTKDYSRLKLFKYKNVQVSTAMDPVWRDILIDGIENKILEV